MAKTIASLSQKTDKKIKGLNEQLEGIRKEMAKLKADEAAKLKEIKEAEALRLSERSAGIGKTLSEKGIDMNKLNEALKSNTELLNMLLGACAEEPEEEEKKKASGTEKAEKKKADKEESASEPSPESNKEVKFQIT